MGNAVQLESGKMLGTKLAGVHAFPSLRDGDTAPLSYAQQQIWLHAQLVPGIPIYNEPVTVHRHGTLDVRDLERSLSEIVRRHQAWRTTFGLAEGEPVQSVQPATPVIVPAVDLSSLAPAERESEARRLAHEDALRLFDLSRGPLFRTLLVHLSDTEHRLFLTLHHIIFDGYSIYRVFLPELATLYDAFSNGRERPLPEISTQYPAFAVWERERFASDGSLTSQLAYWRKQLEGKVPVLQLPSDHPRPAVQSFRGAIEPVVFSKELSNALKLLSRGEGATLFMTLLASFATLLHRYSSLDDVAIGTVSSGRKRLELEGLLGYFLNPLVLRNDLSGDPSFRELLRRTREVALDALSNDDAPFTHVVNEVHPSRSLSFNPLFQVLLTLEPPIPATQDGWTVALTQPDVDTGISKFDLTLELDDRPSGIVGRFKYSTDLFEPETITRMAGHLRTLLEGVVANPERRISELPMLTARERHQLCVEWNDTASEFPAQLCLHEMVTQQAARVPEATAIVSGYEQLTYRELDHRSDQLAAYLRKQGVGPEKPVGLYLEPSIEMIVGILGVLKSGGACVPLDPSYPAERLVHVLADTQLTVLLTQQRLRSQLPPNDAKLLCLDADWVEIEPAEPETVHSQVGAENTAYVIYTSGSTGKPKGVQVTHRNLVHSTYARSLYYGADAGRFLLLSSFAFDSSLVGIFGMLSQGGTLVLTPGPLQSNLTRLAELIEHYRISHLLCVPSLYSLLLSQARPGQLHSLKVAIVAGESCPVELVERHHELLPEADLFNEYGPTEAAVWSTVYKCEPGQNRTLVPIGRPIPNTRVYVLDSHLNPLPVGIAGELYIGGPGVTRGYLNRPQETAERFVADRFNATPGARLYKTGDLVRYLPDGNLELLGRLDHQVKLNGFRIELEEIEAAILEYKGVRQSVVTLRDQDSGNPKLVAYVVPNNASDFDGEALRSFLDKKLPGVMIPAAFVKLTGLPLMPNGKVNRHALPLTVQPVRAAEWVAPEGDLECKIWEIWQSVLGKSEIGATSNFFELGGNSLLVAKLLIRIEQQFGKRLSLANVFQAPTIRQLAGVLDGQVESVQHPAVVPIQPHGSKPPLFWVRGGPLFHALANRLGPDQPFFGLHLPNTDARKLRLPYRLEDIATALVARLREVQPQGPYYLAGLCVNGVIAYEMARQLIVEGEPVAMLALFDAQNPEYYHDFSQESRSQVLLGKMRYLFAQLRENGWSGLPRFARERLSAVARRLVVFYWRIYHALRLRVSEQRLQDDLDTIVHPASYFYRPKPYPGRAIFFQSTDWPPGRYWDFYASWDGLIGEDLEVHKIAGGHQSMFFEENVDLVSTHLSRYLPKTREDASPAGAPAVRTKKKSAGRPARPRFREATFEDYPRISALESRYGLTPKSYDEWTSLWVDNPRYQKTPHWPIAWVCENSDDEIVGSIANIPLSYEFENQTLIAATSRSLVVESRYRAYSLSLLSCFFKQKGVDLFVNTTVNAKASNLQELFGASRVPTGIWDRSAFWITNYAGFAASVLLRNELPGGPTLSSPLSAGLFIRDKLIGRAPRTHYRGPEIQFCATFDDRFDSFWQRLRQSSPSRLLATRSRPVLEWHFKSALARNKAWVLTVSQGRELSAYAVVCRQDNSSLGLRRMRLVDCQTLPGQADLLKPLLSCALKRCQREGIHMLEAIGFGAEKQRVVESLSPYYRELGSWRYFYRANDDRLAERLREPQVWDPSCFDGDSSL